MASNQQDMSYQAGEERITEGQSIGDSSLGWEYPPAVQFHSHERVREEEAKRGRERER
ncbi:hypothetical protein H6P81_004213 [Aristolochia fimbriata]|uniref:LEAFY n=1 Tax=Aristolochia fimbriata TaxID=158543 RepID=A0AAV7FES8_ARIFI|nr:hypothetical protein H6P81_004213 [Aristolochia fimbriata]